MEAGMVVLIVIVALAAGVVIGWLARAGAVAAAKARADELPPLRLMVDALRDERDAARTELAAARVLGQSADQFGRELAQERTRAEALSARCAAFERGESERAEAHAAQLAQLKDMEAKLEARFGELATRALGEAQRHFLTRADERFRQSEEKSSDQLKALLQPVSDRLQRYEEGVAKVEAERRDAFGDLKGLIDSMRIGQERVSSEAAKLVNSLRAAPKARGRWGEQQLRNVLETCGLSEHCDFQTEVSVDSEDGRFRPDVIVRVPGGRTLVIDAKVSLNAFQDAFAAVDEGERLVHLASHASAMKAHVNTLGSKAYQTRFADTADYVIMFVPGEHFLSAALDHDAQLWDYAFERRVLLATPTNLIAIARTVSAVWRQERLASDARRIAELGKELHDRLSKAAGDLRKVGSGLTSAVNNYNSFVSSFESRALVTARKFRDLNIDTGGREIDDVTPVDALARYGDEVGALPSPSYS
jgi:DNA recombination protein RmuC